MHRHQQERRREERNLSRCAHQKQIKINLGEFKK